MKNIILVTFTTVALMTVSTVSLAQDSDQDLESVVASVQKGCEPEIAEYCSRVTLGEGRLAACMYAYEDKISSRCEYALYEAAAQLERAISALTYLASACDVDVANHCAGVKEGEGRLAKCLLDNKAKLRPGCAKAVDEVDLEVN